MVVGQQHIGDYIKRSTTLGTSDAEELELLVQENPWCAAYRVLLAKCHKNESTYNAEHKLQLASLYTGDRSALFNFMHDVHDLQVSQASPEIFPDQAEAAKDDGILETSPEETTMEPKFQEIENSDTEKVDESEIGFDLTGPITEAHEARKEDEETVNPEAEKPPFKLDFEQLVSYDPTRDLKPIEKIPEQEEKVEIPFDHIAYNPEKELMKLVEEQKPQQKDKDFLYWLDQVDEASATKEPSDEPSNVNSNVDEVQDLLEKFIKTKSRKPREKKEFFNPENSARRSIQDDSTLVSESLGELFARQKLYEKAIETFEKLSLQNPAKSAYFAARIQEMNRLKSEES